MEISLVDVSIEVLQKVKLALITFQSDITGISSRTTELAQDCLRVCYKKIDETQVRINELNVEIKKLNNTINLLGREINIFKNKIQQWEESIPCMEKQFQNVEVNISSFQRGLSVLQVQLADTEDVRTRQQIQSQIDRETEKLNSLYYEQSELEYQIRNAKKQKEVLHQKVSELKNEKVYSEEHFAIAKKRKAQYQQKFDRLKLLLNTAKLNLDAYINATRKIESSSASNVDNNIRAVGKCIDYIEKYLSTNL